MPPRWLAQGLGGDVTVLDIADPVVDVGAFLRLDLSDRSSIDSALGRLDAPYHALVSCAGVAGGPLLPRVNFIGQRYLIETAIDTGLLPSGGAVGMIASIGGISWTDNLDVVLEVLDTPDFESASDWIDEHPDLAHYGFSKQAMIVYCARRAPALVQRGIRINCIAPGPTKTPLMDANEGWLGFEQAFAAAMGHPGASPEEQAYPLLFLVSDAASHVSGTCLVVDLGFTSGGLVGSVESPLFASLLPKGGRRTV